MAGDHEPTAARTPPQSHLLNTICNKRLVLGVGPSLFQLRVDSRGESRSARGDGGGENRTADGDGGGENRTAEGEMLPVSPQPCSPLRSFSGFSVFVTTFRSEPIVLLSVMKCCDAFMSSRVLSSFPPALPTRGETGTLNTRPQMTDGGPRVWHTRCP